MMRGGQKGKARRMFHTPKAFDSPYITIIGKNSVRYLLYPLNYNYHKLDKVPTKRWWEFQLHCRACKLMGNLDTFKQYNCLG